MTQFLKKYLVSFLIVVALFLIVFGWASLRFENKLKRIEKNKCEAVCFITRTGNMKGNYVIAEVVLNDSLHTIRSSSPFPDIEPGQEFITYYNCSNPEEYDIRFELPVFTENPASLSTTKPTQIKFDEDCVRYTYTDYLGTEHEKFQQINESFATYGKDSYVEYTRANPKIAILKFRD